MSDDDDLQVLTVLRDRRDVMMRTWHTDLRLWRLEMHVHFVAGIAIVIATWMAHTVGMVLLWFAVGMTLTWLCSRWWSATDLRCTRAREEVRALDRQIAVEMASRWGR